MTIPLAPLPSFNDVRTAPIGRTLRALARLVGYPDATLRAHLAELRDAVHRECALSLRVTAALDALVDELAGPRPLEVEAAYVALFDRGRRTALHLFEHVHGDSRDRGPAMVDLVKTYEQAGLLLGPGELPDHLSVVLEYASTQPPPAARAFLGEIAHLVRVIYSALLRRESRYAAAMAAVLELAGQPVGAVEVPDEESLDQTWQEPAAFDGCASATGAAAAAGRAAPSVQPVQPVRLVRRAAPDAHPAATLPGAGVPGSSLPRRPATDVRPATPPHSGGRA